MAQPIRHVPPADDGAPAAGEVVSRDPATGEVWRRHRSTTPEEVAGAVARARAAQPAWAATDVRARARVIERFRRVLLARRNDVADVITRENGRPGAEALAAEVLITLDYARFYARVAPRALGG